MKRTRIIVGVLSIFFLLIIAAGVYFYITYKSVFIDRVGTHSEAVSLYIPSSSGYRTLCDSLFSKDVVSDTTLFHHTARAKKLPESVHSGHYRIPPHITLNQLVNMLRSGQQTPVNVTFNNIRTMEEMARTVGRQLEADSAEIMEAIYNQDLWEELQGYTPDPLAFFIPNTYEFYWNTSGQGFIRRMYREHQAFWNETRRKKAEQAGLTPHKVATLASIVQEETNKVSEMDRIAGVFINRLERNIKLQADPTLKYAAGDWSIRRVLNKHKTIPSPYNTYMNPGLPPGPISMPEPAAIDKVLNYEKHSYLFFVASASNPGYHDFSKTLREHNIKARQYHQYLNQQRIYR